MIFINFINWICKIFNSNRGDNTFVGLSRLREVKEPVLQEIQKPVNNKNIKISDLIKGGDY
ncbi:MAG: hypothetical protein PHC34_13755 [Candidatus Gastranaerophilales bacterium]|nr:hypothetical protein [Candidatus Gastranaerophilales bacterium]